MSIQSKNGPRFTLLAIITCILLSVVLIACIGFAENRPVPVSHLEGSYRLVFNDEFNNATLDTSKWNTCYESYSENYDGCTNYGNNEGEWYKSSQVIVDDGNLVLTAKRQPTNGDDKTHKPHTYPYVSGMVSTGRAKRDEPAKWSNTYGYYEARIKVPSGDVVWPAFWLLPIDHQWPPEIDVMEFIGHKPEETLHTYFWKGPKAEVERDSSKYQLGVNVADDWHTYAVDWQPDKITWYIDGKVVKEAAGSNVPSSHMQIILNLAIGGNLPGPVTNDTPKTATMLVDYVRVYQKQ